MSHPHIRLLQPADLDDALALNSAAGWNQRVEDWRMLRQLAPGGSFGAVSEGRLVGTAIGVDYEGFGWIAMMLVDPDWRGRGLGGRLLEAALGSLPSDRPVRLDATPRGRTLYQKYGFEDETTLTRHVAEVFGTLQMPVEPDQARRLTVEDLSTVTELDGQVFGGDRRAVLEWALGQAPQYAHVVPSEGGGQYCLGRPGRLFDQIGPVVARAEEVAVALIGAALQAAEGRPVVLDLFDSQAGLGAWLRTAGFRAERPLFRMRRPRTHDVPPPDGDKPRPDGQAADKPVEFAILGPEFG